MNWLADAVGGMTNESARRQGIMTLGEVRAALSALDGTTPVVIDDGTVPSSMASYRGYYERLAIGVERYRNDYKTELVRYAVHPNYDPDPAVASVDIAEPVTAAEMVKALDLADGEVFGGYKGGRYEMHAGTWMHVAEYGDCGRAVYSVDLHEGKAVIVTGEYEW